MASVFKTVSFFIIVFIFEGLVTFIAKIQKQTEKNIPWRDIKLHPEVN